jgi:hypothetical protein
MRQRVALCDQKDPSDLGFSAPNECDFRYSSEIGHRLQDQPCPFGAKTGKAQREQMFSALPLKSDIAE